jgi:hypothetical protein
MTIFELETLGDERVLLPGDDGYARASTVYARSGSPALIVQPSSAQGVARAVRFAGDNGLTLSVRGGGHSGVGHGTNDGGMVIDLALLVSVEVHDDLVRVGGGATWGAVAQALSEHGLALSSGDTASVGVGGLTLGGGLGWMVREFGLALDQLVEAQVVLASGEVVTASAADNPELFWALRGGGGNFGVVTAFTFRAHPLDGVHFGALQFDIDPANSDELYDLLSGWRDVMRAAPDRLTTTFLAMPGFGDQPAGAQIFVCYADADDEAASRAIAPLTALGALTGNTVERTAYAEILSETQHAPEGVRIVDNNGFTARFDNEAVETVANLYAALPGTVLMIRYLGGEFSRVDPDATAFALRDSETLVVSAAFFPPGAPEEAVERYQAEWSLLLPHLQGLYGNFSMLASDLATPLMYPPDTFARLERAKSQYDPGNLFDQNHNIRPGATDWR